MRKSIIALAILCGVGPTMAARTSAPVVPQEECQYSQLQNMIRDARSHEQIFEFIKSGVSMDDKTIRCGGSLLQLAIRRGNPSIVNGILTQDKTRADRLVSLEGFDIPGAPEKIPALLFAAFYAPNELTFKVMMEASNNMSVQDTLGHGVLWYLDKNPVLRQTAMEDAVKEALQKQLLMQAQREMLQKQKAQIVEKRIEAAPDNTPKELAEPNLDESTLASPEDENQ